VNFGLWDSAVAITSADHVRMCGIAGEIRLTGDADIAAVERMAAVLAPRGPDGNGSFAQGGIALAHRRLKIIDLSASGAQPMVDPQLGLAIVFNGCIYNYRELRAELESDGYRFFSRSDTEVLQGLRLLGRGVRATPARHVRNGDRRAR
jgi:asparagine synthetase B (glutamine-hydrolysing)